MRETPESSRLQHEESSPARRRPASRVLHLLPCREGPQGDRRWPGLTWSKCIGASWRTANDGGTRLACGAARRARRAAARHDRPGRPMRGLAAGDVAARRLLAWPRRGRRAFRHRRGARRRCAARRGRRWAGGRLWRRWWWRRCRNLARSSTCYGTRPGPPASTSGGSSPSSPTAPSSTWRSWPRPRSRRAAAAAAPRTSSRCTRRPPRRDAAEPGCRPRRRTRAREPPAAYAVTGEQVREWAFLGWCALIDADKYLRRGSLWEAHSRLHEARHRIWALWAAAQGAMYPWHGLSQVLDHDPGEPAARHRVHRRRPRRGRPAPRRARQRRSARHGQRGRRPAAPGRPPGGDGRLRHARALPRSLIAGQHARRMTPGRPA